jgi:hypothetical protein
MKYPWHASPCLSPPPLRLEPLGHPQARLNGAMETLALAGRSNDLRFCRGPCFRHRRSHGKEARDSQLFCRRWLACTSLGLPVPLASSSIQLRFPLRLYLGLLVNVEDDRHAVPATCPTTYAVACVHRSVLRRDSTWLVELCHDAT